MEVFRRGDSVPLCHKRLVPEANVHQAMKFIGWKAQNCTSLPSICLKATQIKLHLPDSRTSMGLQKGTQGCFCYMFAV